MKRSRQRPRIRGTTENCGYRESVAVAAPITLWLTPELDPPGE
jgi:hypothetical protein